MEATVFGMITSGLIGVSLAAACGFKVFVPMLVMSIAARSGLLHLTEGWSWIGSWPALGAFGVAAVTKAVGYYIPWVDNWLDALQTPAAVVAGTIATAACVADMHPLLQWSSAIIAGVGITGTIQATTVAARAASTLTTGGVANWVVATIELATSLVLSVMAIVIPIIAAAVVFAIAVYVVRVFFRRRAAMSASRSM